MNVSSQASQASQASGSAPDAAEARRDMPYREFARRRDGMIHAMDGGLWLHRHVWKGRKMAHLVSTDRERLLAEAKWLRTEALAIEGEATADVKRL